MFRVTTSKGYDASKLNFVSQNDKNFEFIGRTQANYGVQGYVEKLNSEPNGKNTISVSQIGSVHSQLRQNSWYSSQNMFVLIPNNIKVYNLFVVSAIDRTLQSYAGYSNYPTLKSLKKHKIQLPIKNGEIDFQFIENFVAELEALRVAELEAYLTVTGLKDYALTEEEEKAIQNIKLIEYEEKDVTGEFGVFNVENTKNILSNQAIPGSGKTPYICASQYNNSVSSYIEYKEDLKDKGNCIFIGGKTFVVSYQEKDFFSNDSHNLAMYLKDEAKADRMTQLYLATCVKKSLAHKYSWGDSISNKKIQKDKILIPIKDGKVDYEIMKRIISAIQKLVIKDVVDYADKKIDTTKKVIDQNN